MHVMQHAARLLLAATFATAIQVETRLNSDLDVPIGGDNGYMARLGVQSACSGLHDDIGRSIYHKGYLKLSLRRFPLGLDVRPPGLHTGSQIVQSGHSLLPRQTSIGDRDTVLETDGEISEMKVSQLSSNEKIDMH